MSITIKCICDQFNESKDFGENQMNFIKRNLTFIFHHACVSGNLDLAKYSYNLMKTNEALIKPEVYHVTFKRCLFSKYLDVAKWLYHLKQIDDIFILLYHDDNEIFRSCCNFGEEYLEIIKWLCEIEPRYSYTINHGNINPKIKSLVSVIQRLINKNKSISLLKRSGLISDIKQDNNECPTCLDENKKYHVILNCKHQVCAKCYSKIAVSKQCPFRCKKEFNDTASRLIMIETAPEEDPELSMEDDVEENHQMINNNQTTRKNMTWSDTLKEIVAIYVPSIMFIMGVVWWKVGFQFKI
jgi:hypothetical protein